MAKVKKSNQLITPILLLILLPFLLIALKKIWDIRRGAAGYTANIVIDLANPVSSVTSNLWRNLSQGGEEATDMIKPVVLPLRQIKPELIRIDHVFDYYDNLESLDPIINSILLTGARPLISLSYTKAVDSVDGKNAGAPKDWGQWEAKVAALAKRYSVDKKIDGIYYEVWNEPDLFGGWHYGKQPNYLELYYHSVRGVMTGTGNTYYKVGGPATTAYYSNWTKSLFKYASQNRLRLDFISWHRYSKNPEDYEKDFDSLNAVLSDYPQYYDIERLITEFGPDPEPSSWYENRLSAVHLMSISTRMSGKIHRLFSFEPVDGPTPRSDVSSGWGMITHSNNGSKLKPRYSAFQFLNTLGGLQLTLDGNGSWVSALASKNNSTYQILLVNYDQNGTHAESFPLTLRNLPLGRYQFQFRYFLGETLSKTITTTTNNYLENIYLDPNTALILEITPVQ